ncbi:uncharacterized protein V1510DRAFT_842 [Dipodascopsis tothii]|uniref:uncharacterized protein n=1 Tax=Dipodascopsis tothii TaxID=44089 RepID=UPI0034CFEA90
MRFLIFPSWLEAYRTYSWLQKVTHRQNLYGDYLRWKEKCLLMTKEVSYHMFSGVTYRLMLPFIIPYTAYSTESWKYPLLGCYYFARHPTLWPPFIWIVLPLALLITFVLGGMFTFAFPPQALLMAALYGPVGILSAVMVVFHQSSIIYGILSRSLLINPATKRVFDRVLSRKGYDDLVAKGQYQFPPEVPDRTSSRATRYFLHKCNVKYRRFMLKVFSPYFLFKKVIIVPIRFIPFFGPVIIALLNSSAKGKKCQARYFELKGYNARVVRLYTRQREGGYLVFGSMAGLLEIVPVLGMIFYFTNITGAALWAAKMEYAQRSV